MNEDDKLRFAFITSAVAQGYLASNGPPHTTDEAKDKVKQIVAFSKEIFNEMNTVR